MMDLELAAGVRKKCFLNRGPCPQPRCPSRLRFEDRDILPKAIDHDRLFSGAQEARHPHKEQKLL